MSSAKLILGNVNLRYKHWAAGHVILNEQSLLRHEDQVQLEIQSMVD